MKILTNKEYENLMSLVEGKKQDPRVKELTEEISKINKNWNNSVDDYNKVISDLKADQNIVLARKDAEVETKVYNATKKLTDDLAKITAEKNNATQKAEILETAFKNLGFDVKDMKSILDKLVDGLISKNTVHLVK